jgi:hypothetical protein
MGKAKSREFRAQGREHKRRLDAAARRQRALAKSVTDVSVLARRRPAELTCAWCGSAIAIKPRGRIPTWCSTSCRHRAWEQSRAAASGRSAIKIVNRIVEIHHNVPVPAPAPRSRLPRQAAWVGAVKGLTQQLNTGELYDKHLAALASAVVELNTALELRLTSSSRR